MRLVQQCEYNFISYWHIQAPRQQAAHYVEDVTQWASWWPSVTNIQIQGSSNNVIGSKVNMTWQAPLGYKLSLQIEITERITAEKIVFLSSGDLLGSGSWDMHENGDATDMTIKWNVVTTKRWMNVAAPLLRPIFTASHQRVMRRGEVGLNRILRPKA